MYRNLNAGVDMSGKIMKILPFPSPSFIHSLRYQISTYVTWLDSEYVVLMVNEMTRLIIIIVTFTITNYLCFGTVREKPEFNYSLSQFGSINAMQWSTTHHESIN